MAIITHRLDGDRAVENGGDQGELSHNSDNSEGSNGGQKRPDAESVLMEYVNGEKSLTEMQGWELKRLGEACKELVAEGMLVGAASHALDRVREEWQRRKALERNNPEAAKAEAAERDEISERTGKPKKLPRGKPFQRGKDERRNESGNSGEGESDEQGESGEGEGEGEGDSENESQGESQSQGKSQSDKLNLPPESTEENDGMMESIMRRIAREEDYKVVTAVDANFTALAKELARVAKLAASGGSGGKTIIVDKSTERTAIVDGHPHEALEKCVRAVRAGFRNILLVGPAGSGKSTLGRQLAKADGSGAAEILVRPDHKVSIPFATV